MNPQEQHAVPPQLAGAPPNPDAQPAEPPLMVCVDLDGTLAEYDGWQGVDHFGPPRDSAAGFMQQLIDAGYHVVVYTTRTNENMPGRPPGADKWTLIQLVEEWLERNNIPFHEVWSEDGKPPAAAFVDDKAVPVPQNPYPEDYARALQMIVALTQPQQPPPGAAPSAPLGP